MALDIIEIKLFKEPKKSITKSIPKYRCNSTFRSKAFDFMDLPKILNPLSNFEISDILMVA